MSHKDCPSDLVLDRYLAGELGVEERTALENHLHGCAGCDSLVQQRSAETQAFVADPSLPRRASAALRRVRQKRQVSTAKDDKRSSWTWRLFAPGLAVAATVALLVLVILPRQAGDLEQNAGTRLKGGFSLGTFLKRGEQVTRARSGQVFQPGDRLRFTYSAQRQGHLCLVGLDAKDVVTTYAPVRPVAAAVDRPLPEATVLDETLGRESVVGVLCPRPFDINTVRQHLRELIPAIRKGHPLTRALPAPGCQTALFELVKERPRQP